MPSTSANILVVDDEEPVRRMVMQLLRQSGYACVDARSAEEARARLDTSEVDLVLSDITMPGGSGLDLVRDVVRSRPGAAVVMLTGEDDPAMGELALGLGAYGYITKPFKSNELLINVANALRRRQLEKESRRYQQHLESIVESRTTALSETILRLRAAEAGLERQPQETIRRLAKVAAYHDIETANHIVRMAELSALLAERAGHAHERVELLRLAAPMHDIGKIGIPDRILRKAGPHTPEEAEVMRTHAEIGYRILSGSGSELLDLAATIAWTHHERWDGGGYPRGLAGDAIPLVGRVVAIADVFDALTTKRCYKLAWTFEDAVAGLRAEKGRHFDPELLEVFLGARDDLLAIRARLAD